MDLEETHGVQNRLWRDSVFLCSIPIPSSDKQRIIYMIIRNIYPLVIGLKQRNPFILFIFNSDHEKGDHAD